MSDMKTVENDADPAAFLASVENRGRAEDAAAVTNMMARVTGLPPRMWGDSIIGFGAYDYKRRDGSAHRFFLTGVSPRKQKLTIYIMPGFKPYQEILSRLGPHKHSASCLLLGRLAKVNLAVLEELVAASVSDMRAEYS
ncbi:MAG: DUF1801 domain-containing protein [Pseudomonadota bacterium]